MPDLLLPLLLLLVVDVQSFATLYNIPQPWTPGYAAVDVLQASRSLVWLKGEEALITYDRATTAHSGKFKRWNMNFIAPPTVSGNVVTAVGKVNKVAVTTLLPANRNITVQVSWFALGGGRPDGVQVLGTHTVHSTSGGCLLAWSVDCWFVYCLHQVTLPSGPCCCIGDLQNTGPLPS